MMLSHPLSARNFPVPSKMLIRHPVPHRFAFQRIWWLQSCLIEDWQSMLECVAQSPSRRQGRPCSCSPNTPQSHHPKPRKYGCIRQMRPPQSAQSLGWPSAWGLFWFQIRFRHLSFHYRYRPNMRRIRCPGLRKNGTFLV